MDSKNDHDEFVNVEPNVETEVQDVPSNNKMRAKAPSKPAFEFSVQNCWHVFDKIFCVIPEGDDARRQVAETFFKKHNVPVEFFVVPKHQRGNDITRFEGHILAMRAALKDSDTQNCLIFDNNPDILQMPSAECVKDVCQFLAYRNFDIFALDAVPDVLFHAPESVNNFKRVFKTHTHSANAYVVSRKFMERMVKMDFELMQASLGQTFAINNNTFATLPPWFGVSIDPADAHSNTAQILDVLQKTKAYAHGWYGANSKGLPAIVIVLIAILIVFVLLVLLL